MDDDTDRDGPEIDEPEDDLGLTPATTGGSRRVRIIGAEQAASVLPPDGFAVTDDPLEAELDDDPLESFDEGRPLDLRWSSADPVDEQGTEMPHWTDPPTGQVPAVLARDEPDLPEWQRAGDTGPVWREHDHDWADPGFEPSMLADEETQVGELRTHDTSEERRPWDFGGSVERSDDIWAGDESPGSDEEDIGVLDSVAAGPVTTISSSVRRVALWSGPGSAESPPPRAAQASFGPDRAVA